MKRLTLVCACGKRREFRGESIVPILDQMDASGWEEIVRNSKHVSLGYGVIRGTCPDPACKAAEAAEDAAFEASCTD